MKMKCIRHRQMRSISLPLWLRMGGGVIAESLVLAILLLWLFFAASRVEANAGPPYYTGGQVVAEPSGLAGIAIAHETLDIDMRGLSIHPRSTISMTGTVEISNPITVSVVYSITNSGAAREGALLFASGAPSTANFAASLDDQPIAAQPVISVTLPTEWQPPRTTPGLNGSPPLPYVDPKGGQNQYSPSFGQYRGNLVRAWTATYAFTVTFPAGESALAIRYHADPQIRHSGGYLSSLDSYQFAYVLAPARAWDGFGGLDVTVHLPACWEAAALPELARAGDELRGAFDAVPADALALTVAPCTAAREADQEARQAASVEALRAAQEKASRTLPGICAPPALILPLAALGIVLRCRTRRNI